MEVFNKIKDLVLDHNISCEFCKDNNTSFFLKMTEDSLPNEDFWREFFSWCTEQNFSGEFEFILMTKKGGFFNFFAKPKVIQEKIKVASLKEIILKNNEVFLPISFEERERLQAFELNSEYARFSFGTLQGFRSNFVKLPLGNCCGFKIIV
jgi:hypothetical protein